MPSNKCFKFFGTALCGFLPLIAAAPKPSPARSMSAILSQTAAVVEGTVSAVHPEYDPARGPRTVAILSNLRVHMGSLGGSPAEVRLESFGGKLPNGKTIHATHVPSFTVGQHVVVFLRNTEWFLSPVVGGNAFTVASVGGKQVVVNGAGATVLGMDAAGPTTGNIVLPVNPNGTRASAPPPGVAVEPEAMGVPEFIAALRTFAASSGAAIAGAFSPSPISNRAAWNRLATQPATPPSNPVERKPCFANSPPGVDSDEAAVKQCFEGDKK